MAGSIGAQYSGGARRVLLIVPWLRMGGADQFNLDLIRTLARRGYVFTVATTIADSDPWLDEFTRLTPDVLRLPQFLAVEEYPGFLNHLVESRQVDAVIISNSEWGYDLAPFLRALHPRLALLDYNHLEEEEWLDGGYPRLALRAADQLDLHVTCTEHLKRWMAARGADPTRIQVCHCNIDTQEWSPAAHDRAAIRAQWGVADAMPMLLFAGRMVTQKRPEMLGGIIQRLAEGEPDFVCFVAGAGPELPALCRFARRAGLRRHMRLLGAVPRQQVRELMAAADILLLPSRNEGLALVLYEALALETVPVAADVGGQRELVTPECGYLIPPGPDELAGYVAALAALMREPARRQALAQQGRQRVVAQFDLERMADGMAAALEQAQRLAAARAAHEPDADLARQIAARVVAAHREAELAGMQWARRGAHPVFGRLRRLREQIWPIGSRRYEDYKRFRAGVRHTTGALRRVATTRQGRAWGLLACGVAALAVVALLRARGTTNKTPILIQRRSRARARRRVGPR
jgi:glycosyltransferase involved in cell wall biosynthesis